MKKSFAAIALAGSIALVGAVPAMAQTSYVSAPAQGTVSDGTVDPGQTFTFFGAGFAPGETITITVGTQTFTATADGKGAIAFPLSINTPGTFTVTAKGATSGNVATAAVTVAAAAIVPASLANTGGGTALANTGADASLVLWSLVGAGALAAGVTSVVVVRRRAKAEVAA